MVNTTVYQGKASLYFPLLPQCFVPHTQELVLIQHHTLIYWYIVYTNSMTFSVINNKKTKNKVLSLLHDIMQTVQILIKLLW